ncbi:MAG TPA: hypothetical protein EYG83_02485 [Sulfurospirillum arcachonense]|nr:hypothetical protein [Sulfurospirillum arcachonense]
MQIFENLLHEEDERAITGFVNSNGNLEHNIYKQVDGGYIDLEDRVYDKDELLELLEIELDDFDNKNIPTLILGHEICVKLVNDKDALRSELDDEVYEISHSIMQSDDFGEIFIESKKEKAYWDIIK